MMNLNQTKFVGLTMELQLKTQEYKKICNKLEELKKNNINPNDEKLVELRNIFQKNHDEIVNINKQIKELKESQESIEKQRLQQYDVSNLFKRNNKIYEDNQKEDKKLLVIETNKNVIIRIIEKIREFLKK